MQNPTPSVFKIHPMKDFSALAGDDADPAQLISRSPGASRCFPANR
jgi:hypothetical protein